MLGFLAGLLACGYGYMLARRHAREDYEPKLRRLEAELALVELRDNHARTIIAIREMQKRN